MSTKQHDNGEQQTNMNHQSKTRKTKLTHLLDGKNKHPNLTKANKIK